MASRRTEAARLEEAVAAADGCMGLVVLLGRAAAAVAGADLPALPFSRYGGA